MDKRALYTVPAIQKLNHLKSGHFCPDFKWFLTKWQLFVRISNGWAFGFQMPFENPDHLQPNLF